MGTFPGVRVGWLRFLLPALLLAILGFALAQGRKGEEIQAASAYLGDRPLALAESSRPILKSTPEELLQTILNARKDKDVAALARCSSTSLGRPLLDQIDTARVERDFFDSNEKLWQAIEQALASGTLQVEISSLADPVGDPPVEARAELIIPMPKNTNAAGLEELHLRSVRVLGQWVLEVMP